MKELRITAAVQSAIEAHAAETYPDECCGIIVERGGGLEALRVTNRQNELHAENPTLYPRDARIAYNMGAEVLPIIDAHERGKLRLHAFYHSHPEHEAYFSAEDKTSALGGWDEPTYPETGQIVISVRERTPRYAKAFAWDEAARDFVEVPLVVQ